MKEWHIQETTQTSTILIDDVTILKGNQLLWQQLIDSFQNYFSHKGTALKIYQDQTLLPRNDFEFIIFSPNKHFDSAALDKVVAQLKKTFLNQLEFSPFYKGLVDSWDELVDEVDFLNQQNSSKIISFKLEPFDKKWISNELTFSKNNYLKLSNFDKLIFQLNLLESDLASKQRIICIISPENFLLSYELEKLDSYLSEIKNGIKYLVITEQHFNGSINVLYKGTIRNVLDCYKVKEKLASGLPFSWSDEQFLAACNWYMKLVDNYQTKTVLLNLKTVDNLEAFTYLYSLFILTDTTLIVDLTGIPLNLASYFDNIIQSKV
ncbi:hypothetical protein LHA31_04035 [Carnobacterium viridans]|uniref:Uncharacterized protein n=1 Tax=Carnobacterium viridans TaxID=174587 RepID=A0A1H1B3Y6_9LACT|nr:hypothetical protein [Carnobacterium viridans]UDE95939.1 hypothetical protein LHA31_04035 [Carnobacterium viridans]SDQ46630.1 hypothetical protein SAMN04487752_2412 [Carnobacterium viridans]